MTKPGYFVFQPANDDPSDGAMVSGARYVQHAFFPKDQSFAKREQFTHLGSMAELSGVDPAVLVVFGHGNMGAGIGTHKTHYDEDALARLLMTNGLKTKQKNLTMYLWACNTGAYTPGSGMFSSRKEPFAKRFAQKLHEYNFSGVRVVGVAGFIAGSGSFTSLKYKGKPLAENPPTQPTDVARHVMFDVATTGVTALTETKWICERAPGNQGWAVRRG